MKFFPAAKLVFHAAALVALTEVAVPGALYAQGAPATRQATPASSQTVNTLFLTGAVTSCEFTINDKVPIEKSIFYTSRSIASVIGMINDFQVEGAGKLDPERLFNAAAFEIIRLIKPSECYGKLAEKDKKFIDTQMSSIEKQIKSQQGAKAPASN